MSRDLKLQYELTALSFARLKDDKRPINEIIKELEK